LQGLRAAHEFVGWLIEVIDWIGKVEEGNTDVIQSSIDRASSEYFVHKL
jgi:hypothetical protein